MTNLTRDPLLAVAKGLLLILMGAMIVAGIACLIAMPAIVIAKATIVAGLTSEAKGFDSNDFLGALLLVLLLIALLCALLWKLFQLLKRIVDTVGLGDPFVPVNADRLTTMAWLVLAVQVATIPLGLMGMWIAEHAADHVDLDIDGGISGNGLLLMLVLFILARVFRHGAAMREELEATV